MLSLVLIFVPEINTTMSTTAITIGSIIKAYFLFLGFAKDPIKGQFEEWLQNDGFKLHTVKDGSKKFLLTELQELKDKFRHNLIDSNHTKDENGNPMTPLKTTELIAAAMVQIDKLRLLIQHDLSIVKNLHKPTGVNYVVARAYWIDERGKKFRKFAKNIGADEKVMENGKIPTWRLDEVEKEIDRMMLKQYREEYP
jgi:hypothetical protein